MEGLGDAGSSSKPTGLEQSLGKRRAIAETTEGLESQQRVLPSGSLVVGDGRLSTGACPHRPATSAQRIK